jgi:hypothetical protein
MSDAKKCDCCGTYYGLGGFRLERNDDGGRVFGQRYEWDVCCLDCLHVTANAIYAMDQRRVAKLCSGRWSDDPR